MRSASPLRFNLSAPTAVQDRPFAPDLIEQTRLEAQYRLREQQVRQKAEVAEILARAAAAAEAAATAPPPSLPSFKDESSSKKSSKPKLSKEEKEAAKEKQLQKLVSPIVVKCMSKYKDKIDHDTFKKHAKEVSSVL